MPNNNNNSSNSNSYPIHHHHPPSHHQHPINTHINHIPQPPPPSFTSINPSNYNPSPHIGNSPSNSVYQYTTPPSPSPFATFTQLPVSIQNSGVCHQGVSTRDFVLRLCALNPSLIPLVLVMKQFLQVIFFNKII